VSTNSYLKNPINGIQVDVEYWVENSNGTPTAYLQLKLPLVSEMIEDNYAHTVLRFIRKEIQCATLVTTCTLIVLGFTTTEINDFMKTIEVQLLELTWHTPTEIPLERNPLKGTCLDGDVLKLALCEETAPEMIKKLRRGLDFLRDGVSSDLDWEDARNEWLVRWRAFADRDGGGKKYLEREENKRKLLLSAAWL
jgi:hypothetical protein